jgi:hypothetical protein
MSVGVELDAEQAHKTQRPKRLPVTGWGQTVRVCFGRGMTGWR